MLRILTSVRQRWGRFTVVMQAALVAAVAGLVLAGSFFIGGNLDTLLWVLAIVVGAVLLLGIITFIVRRIEKRKGDSMSSTLWQRMTSKKGGVEEGGEVKGDLEARWKDVHATLKERNYNYYSFPWFLIIGASQSGKTTSIQKSNQEFPIGDKPIIDYGGTKGCNWFFTNKAIMIDTAGRYVDHLARQDVEMDSMLSRDQAEWDAFLKLLRDMRSRSPINGVILTVKLEDLLEPDPQRWEATAETLRRALLDIEEKLGIRVPVYLLVTMVDLVVGFVDYFDHLPGLSDRTLFGWSRKTAYDKEFDAASEFPPAFAGLCDKLDHLLVEFQEESAGSGELTQDEVTRIDRMSAFPSEFRGLGEPLERLLSHVFATSAFNDQHFFRGVYFTSGVQEGAPVVGACADLLGDKGSSMREEDVGSLGKDQKAYFIADLYEEKIFKEAGLARLTRRASQSQRKAKVLSMSIAGVVAASFGGLAIAGLMNLPTDKLFKVDDLQLLTAGRAAAEDGGVYWNTYEELGANIVELGSLGGGLGALFEGGQIDAHADTLRDAYRKLWADEIFRPQVEGLLAARLEGGLPSSWEDMDDLARLLLALRRLGHGEDDMEVDAFRAEIIEGLLEVWPDANVGGDEIGPLLAMDWLTLVGVDDDPLEHVRAVAAERELLDAIDGLFEAHVVGFWLRWADGFLRPLAAGADQRPGNPDLQPIWDWTRVHALDEAAGDTLGDMVDILRKLESQREDLDDYREDVVAAWSEQFQRLDALRRALVTHVGAWPELEDTLGGALASLELALAPLDEMAGADPEPPQSVLNDIGSIRREVNERKDRLTNWARQESKRTMVALEKIEGALAVPGGAAAAAAAAGLGLGPYDLSVQLEHDKWNAVLACHDLVTYAERDEPDPALDPGTKEFWAIGIHGYEEGWLVRQGADFEPDDEHPRAVRDLVKAVRDEKDTLQTIQESAFFDAWTSTLRDEGDRRQFIERVDFTQSESIKGDKSRPMAGHWSNAEAAAGVCRTVDELLGAYERATNSAAGLWGTGRSSQSAARENLTAMVDLLLEEHFFPFWQETLLDDAELGSQSQLPPAIPLDSSARVTWQAFADWADENLGANVGALRGIPQLARHTGSQEFQVFQEFNPTHLSLDGDGLSAVALLWKRYDEDRPEAPEPPAVQVEAVVARLEKALIEMRAVGGALQGADRAKQLLQLVMGSETDVLVGLQGPGDLVTSWAEDEELGLRNDPILDYLVQMAESARRMLGNEASSFARRTWASFGEGGTNVGRAIAEHFPFYYREGDDEHRDNADPALVTEFFSTQGFQDLVELVWPGLGGGGSQLGSFFPEGSLRFATPQDTEAFKFCVGVYKFCGFEAELNGTDLDPVKIKLHDGFDRDDVRASLAIDLGQRKSAGRSSLATGFGGVVDLDWIPTEGTEVTIEADEDERLDWKYDGPWADEKTRWSLLALVFGNPEVDAKDVAQRRKLPEGDVRWIRIPMRDGRKKSYIVLGIETAPPLPGGAPLLRKFTAVTEGNP